MPDIIMHTSFGREVAQRLNLDVDRDIFDFAAMGPDPYLFYRFFVPPFRNRVTRYASAMHRERTGDFLTELARRAKGSREMFSYLAGYLCHYALDADTHPYIFRKAKNSGLMHMAIEHKLDNMTGGSIVIPPFLPESMKDALGGAIRTVYGWDDAWEMLKKGHSYSYRFYRFVGDEKGWLDFLARISHTKLALVSYRSKSLDTMDLRGFYPLYARALDDAARYITAAQAFIAGEIGEADYRKVVGSRSFIEG